MYDPVEPKVDFPALERDIMAFWQQDDTFAESLRQRSDGPRFTFYEGPPTANGRPGTHHILARAFKDLFGRYRTMKGDRVERKAGWDTHGLPVELEVEKKLGISGKFEIENEVGIEEFNRRCRESVHEYVRDWEQMSQRMAFWLDYDNAYWTFTSDYIQSVWWALRQMWDRDLIYKGYRVAPYCPRCSTPLSSHELAQGYRDDTTDPSVFVRFRLVSEPGTSILAWTTTPWTLPGNVGLAVGPDIPYVRVRAGGEVLILAEARLEVLEGDHEVIERMTGRDLVGLRYEPLYRYLLPEDYHAFVVVAADFVSTEDGTGVVHTAAAYGADDLRLCQDNGLLVRHTVDLRGRFLPEVEKFAGLFVKDADPLVIDDLRERGLMYRSETIQHTYPFCWRCETPLIYFALDSWYIRTTAVRDELVRNNAQTNWVPAHIRQGRMGDWLENNVDWAFSRSRYWGTPLPFWACTTCDEVRCVESAADLGLAPDSDLHRPHIDAVVLACNCGGEMRRVPEVLDCWFDSGAMPFAQRGYPWQNRKEFEQSFPAQFISEAIDQTRGWFYSMLAISTILFGRNAFENVICLGHVLDEKGQKASKSRGNVMDPQRIFDEFGSDAIRWFFFISAVGENYRVGPRALQETVRRFITLWNVYSFLVTYARIDGFRPGERPEVRVSERAVLDRWLLARLQGLVATVDASLQTYDVNGAARPVADFLEDLSNWYVRRSRKRFWKSDSDQDKLAAYQTLHTCLVTVSRLMAPFTPFLAEAMYRNLTGERSVHLADFPVAESTWADPELEGQMAAARRAVEAGLAARDAAGIKVRQPLAAAHLPGDPLHPEVAAIVREELNVKQLEFGAAEVALDTEITQELRLEGLARDVVRAVQECRKRSGFNLEDRIVLHWDAGGLVPDAIAAHGAYISGETLATAMPRAVDGLEGATESKIGGEVLRLRLERA